MSSEVDPMSLQNQKIDPYNNHLPFLMDVNILFKLPVY